MKNILKYMTFIFTGMLILTSCIDENFDDSSTVGLSDKPILLNVINDENQSGDLDIFLQLVEAEGLTGALTSRRTQDQRTVFVPTDNAFEILVAQLGFSSLDELLEADVDLVEILETHIGLTSLSAEQIQNGSFRQIATLSGINVPVRREAGSFILNANQDLEVLRSNAQGNGTIHVISRVMLPVRFNVDFATDFGGELDDCNAILDDWTINNVVLTGGSGWACTRFGFDGQGIQANGFDGGPQEVDSWIISPVLASNDVVLNTLKFKYASRFDGPNPEIWVISESNYNADINIDDWTKLDFNFPPPASGNGVFSDQSVSIPSAIHSNPYRIAFRYISGTGATRVTIDNVEVGEE